MNEIEKSHSRGRRKTVIGLDPILAGFWLANMGRQPGNTVALVGWGLGIKWVNFAAFSILRKKLSQNLQRCDINGNIRGVPIFATFPRSWPNAECKNTKQTSDN